MRSLVVVDVAIFIPHDVSRLFNINFELEPDTKWAAFDAANQLDVFAIIFVFQLVYASTELVIQVLHTFLF